MGVDRRRAVFLDRDGVLNKPIVRAGRPHPPDSVAAFELYGDVAPALAALRRAGFALVVVTNQPDVARGTQSRAQVEAMHDVLRRELNLEDIRVCFHDDDSGCACRKPRPGLLLQGGFDLAASFMIGDRWRDVAAGHAAGCRTVFIDRGYDERRPDSPDASVPSLSDATEWILRQMNGVNQ